MFQRILFPVDFSPCTAATVPSVRAMVKRFGSQLTVLHVVDLPPAVGIAPPEAAAWATLIGADHMRAQGKLNLEHFVAHEFPDFPVTQELAEGDPATTIVDYAREKGCDLIMMPTRGAGPFRRLLLGSVTAKVLHDTTVPVWTGAHAEEIAAYQPDRWQYILCALDGEPRCLPVLQWASEFACNQQLELRLVHAIDGPEECKDNLSFRKFLFDVARERIEKLQAQVGTRLPVCFEVGKPAHVIHQAAVGHSADLVVIGRGLIQKPFGRLRSAAYEIIRESPCPVISV